MDIKAAFPSVAHQFLFLTLRFLKAPLWFVRFLKALYTNNSAVNFDGQFRFWILSGVLQGCPLSGSLFALTFDSILRALAKRLASRCLGEPLACADDVGTSLKSLLGLPSIAKLFKVVSLISGLSLNVSKTVLVPLGALFTEALEFAIRFWISQNCPEWSQIQISSCAKYLGFILGPGAIGNKSSLAAPLQKFRTRIETIVPLV